MIPLAMLIARANPLAALSLSFLLWLFVQISGYNLSARPGTDDLWYFNPLAWQFLFFVGFAFGMKWIAAPNLRQPFLVGVSAVIVVASIPLNFWGFNQTFDSLEQARIFLAGDGLPTLLGWARILHFLALAYLVLSLIDPYRQVLARALWAKPMLTIGRQTLPVFLSSIVIGWLMGIAFDVLGTGFFASLAINLLGLLAAIAVALVVTWYKATPWRAARRVPEATRKSPASEAFAAARIQPAQ
jgi:hypothetical protein